jgi:hypothetical protein
MFCKFFIQISVGPFNFLHCHGWWSDLNLIQGPNGFANIDKHVGILRLHATVTVSLQNSKSILAVPQTVILFACKWILELCDGLVIEGEPPLSPEITISREL